MKTRKRQSGFTITELLIAVALGLTVISSVTMGYLATFRSSVGTLAASKLTQDMNALMTLMVADLRRAGYSGGLAAPLTNSFSILNATALEVIDNMTSDTQAAAQGSGTCVVYSYDINHDGVVDDSELLGFRLNSGVLQMRTSGLSTNPDSCANATGQNWSDLTDADFMTVDELTFDLAASACLNIREPDNIDNDTDGTVDEDSEGDCYASVPAGGSGNITVETREVQITMEASLTNDSNVSLRLSQDVRVRNDWVRAR